MANVIAVVWDFDKTLIPSYMQDPIFKKFGVESKTFWDEVNALPKKYKDEQNVKVNPDTIYLNHMLRYVRSGRFANLNNELLRKLGEQLVFYPGIPDIFEELRKLIDNDPTNREYGIKLEHYVVSTGLVEMIRGSSIMKHITHVWGCEFIEDSSPDGVKLISEIGYTIDNTTKTRALFEISKGVHDNPTIDVNSKIPDELRRVQFKNMIYIADGPSDVPAFSVINRFGGATFAIYPVGNKPSFVQVEGLRASGRIDMYAEANYSKGTTAHMWLTNKVTEFAARIREDAKTKLAASTVSGPRHLV